MANVEQVRSGGSLVPAIDQTMKVGLTVGLATSIGSLPHLDPRAAAELSLAMHPRLPAAPSLPLRSPHESMLGQAAAGVQGLSVLPNGLLEVDVGAVDPLAPVAPSLDGESFVGLRSFIDVAAGRVSTIKVQVTGPVTFATALVRAGVEPKRALAVAVAAVRIRAQAIVELVADRLPGVSLVAFLDEPTMVLAGEPEFPFPLVDAIDAMSSALAVLERQAITGVHCCGNTDWRAIVQTGANVITFPLGCDIERGSAAISGFLEGGGWVAWGAVPTDGPIGSSSERLWKSLASTWCSMVTAGCDPTLVRVQALVTPVCGLAAHGLPQALQVLELTADLAARSHDQAIGARFSMGA